MTKLYCIGDIHGCLNELTKLLEIVDKKISKNDKIVFVGDYIDRGPDSKGVVDLLVSRQKTHANEHIFLKGNHEDMMLKGEYWSMNGGVETVKSYGLDTYDSYNPDVYKPVMIKAGHGDFYKNLKPYYHEGRTVVVHAGLNPFVPLENQETNVMFWDRSFYGWENDYVGGYMVVIGHTPSYEVVEKKNQLAIDTACVFGGKLTCAVVDAESGTMVDLIQVKSEFSYR